MLKKFLELYVDVVDLIILKSIPRLGDVTLRKIVAEFQSFGIASLSANAAPQVLLSKSYSRFHDAFKDLLRPSELRRQQFLTNLSIKSINEHHQTKVIGISDDCYPKSLARLSDAPCILYARGNLKLLHQRAAIAIVGTRNPTTLGKSIAAKTTGYFSQNGIVIVSGLALGIDTEVHTACLEGNGHTIAILASIDKISPNSNSLLARNIINNEGLLLSENPPSTKIIPAHFVRRDRLQSALCSALFIIESTRDGGSMHAARVAKKLGIQTYVPDPVYAGYLKGVKQIEGTLELLSSGGAKSYSKESYPDILSRIEQRNFSAVENIPSDVGTLF